MHEWTIAMSVISSVEKWSIEKNMNVKRIYLSIPSFSMLEVEILLDAFNKLKKESKICDAELEVRVRDQKFGCRNCKNIFTIDDIKPQLDPIMKDHDDYELHELSSLLTTFVKCPKCESRDFEVDASIRVEGLEV
ncbi:MAG: hydrogenase maturation nickel metallochaperone HypA [Archaeoglobaceae archaeon]|nr:hydrogenase/urease maturation nickel metallochaperone HypA [Archaeoglobaceae archaeon]MDW7990089.1 hydrogenase maturation nickel metallochaperone HypA [Archaeoglobaceae archaeon]